MQTSDEGSILHPKDKPADIVVARERRRVSYGPGFSREQRIVELANPLNPRRDPSPRRPRRSSRSANAQNREMVPASKGVLGLHHLKDKPADVVVEREWRHVSHGPGFANEQRIVKLTEPLRPRRDPSSRRPRRSSRSDNPQDRKMLLASKGRRRHDSSDADCDSESDSDTDGSSPRRVRSHKHYGKDLPVARTGPIYANPPYRPRSMDAPRSRSKGPSDPPRRYDSDGDSSSDDDGGKKAQPKPPPKQILYTGLACIAAIAATNNIYQSAKAHYTRQKELEEGQITGAEAQKLKMQARKMDLISLGVAAVGAYNVRNGWKRAEGHWKAHKEMQAEVR